MDIKAFASPDQSKNDTSEQKSGDISDRTKVWKIFISVAGLLTPFTPILQP